MEEYLIAGSITSEISLVGTCCGEELFNHSAGYRAPPLPATLVIRGQRRSLRREGQHRTKLGYFYYEEEPGRGAEVSGKEKAADSWAALSLTAGLALVVMTLDNASVPSIGRHAATGRVARLVGGGASVGCGQDRKGGTEDDYRGKCDLCYIRHCLFLRFVRALTGDVI
jgi:hypothetical protein